MKTSLKMKKRKVNYQAVLWTLIAFGAVLALWQIASLMNFGRIKMPLPVEVFKAFFRGFVEPIGKHSLLTHVSISLYRVMIGLAIATGLGVVTGVSMGISDVARAIIKPVFEFIRPIPPLAWIPLSILWFGLGTSNKVFIIFLGSFAYITLNAYDGARNVNPTLIGAARMLGANKFQIFNHIILPSSVPYIFAGLQVAVTSSWSAVVAAEIVNSEEGAGWIITMGLNNGNTIQIIVGMIAIGIVGYFLSTGMRAAERRLCRWNRKS